MKLENDMKANCTEEFPVEIVQKQLRPTYVYRLPDNENMCHRFWITCSTKLHFTLVCNGCHGVYLKKRKQKQPIPYPPTRKAKNSSTESDPALNHIDGCEPVIYSETIRIYQPVIEENTESQDTFNFPLEKTVKNDTYLLVHRFQDDPTKCLRFQYVRVGASGSFAVICATCSTIMKKTKTIRWQYNLTEDGFLEDPRLHHLPGCSPLLYAELLIIYKLVDNEISKLIFHSWISQRNGENVDKCQSSANKGIKDCINIEENQLPSLGIRVIETKKQLTFFYKIPNTNTCLRFQAVHIGRSSTSIRCVGCHREYERITRTGNQFGFSMKRGTSDGFSMKEDPTTNHSPGCTPEVYSEAIKAYRMVETANPIKGTYEFSLIRMRKPGDLQVMHRLDDDPTKCYLFSYHRKSKSSWLTVICMTCRAIAGRKRKIIKKNQQEQQSPITHRVAETGFLDDPLLGHHPECEPASYENVMRKSEFVDAARAKKFIHETFNSYINEEDDETATTEFPSLVVQKKNAVSFVYRIPSIPTNGYLFYQRKHNDNSELVCSTCIAAGESEIDSRIVVRKSDGFSMELNPAKNHLNHCNGRPLRFIWEGKYYQKEDGKTNPERKYNFSLEKRSKRERYCAIYRLKDDNSKCYKFHSSTYAARSAHLLVTCAVCCQIAIRQRKFERENDVTPHKSKKVKVVSYRVTSSGLLDDPSLRHVSGCEALRFEDLMKEYAISGEQETRDFFKHNYTATQTHGIDLARRGATKRTLKVENAEESDSSTNDEGFRNDEFIESPSPRKNELSPVNTLSNQASYAVKMEIDNDNSIDYSDENVKLETTDYDNNQALSEPLVPKIEEDFSRVYDVSFFTGDEAHVRIVDRTVIVECKREVSAVGVESCFLRYAINLPDSIDISTVQTTWKQGQMILTAERMLQ